MGFYEIYSISVFHNYLVPFLIWQTVSFIFYFFKDFFYSFLLRMVLTYEIIKIFRLMMGTMEHLIVRTCGKLAGPLGAKNGVDTSSIILIIPKIISICMQVSSIYNRDYRTVAKIINNHCSRKSILKFYVLLGVLIIKC
jgi:hypothetical protein